MREKEVFGILFLSISLISFLIPFSWKMTGGAIGVEINFSYLYFISLIFMVAAFLVFISKQTLDAIMIPTAGYKENPKRTRKAADRYLNGGAKVLLISGVIDRPINTSQTYEIYKQLRSYGVKPGNIVIEGKSQNSLDNMLNSLEKLKKLGARDVGIASSPSQLDRYEDIIKEAKKEGVVDKDFTIHRLEVPEDFTKRLYGTAARLVYRYRLSKGLRYAREHENNNKVINWIKANLFR